MLNKHDTDDDDDVLGFCAKTQKNIIILTAVKTSNLTSIIL
jgi:hypothetical protein